MKNLKMALKIGIGFGLIVLVMCILSAIALRALNEQEKSAVGISDIYMTELDIGIKIDRAASDALTGMLRYINTEEIQNANDAKTALKEIQAQVGEAEKLIARYPQLEGLKANILASKPVIQAYAGQVDRTVELQERLKQRRFELIEIGERYMNLLDTMLADQNKRLDNTITNFEGTAEISRRLVQTRLLNTMLDLGAAVRMSNFQSQVLRDPAIAQKGLDNFGPMLQTLEQLDASVQRDAAHEEIRQIRETMEAYRKGFEALVNEWKTIQTLNEERSRNIAAMLNNAQETAHIALEQVQELCKTSVTVSGASMRTMIICTVGGVLISFILAWLLTRAITGPLRKSVDFAQTVAAGALDKSLDIDQKDEVGHLATALNSMVATLRQRITDAQDAIAKASAKEQEALAAMRDADEARKQAEQAKRQGMLDAARQLEGVVNSVNVASDELSTQSEQSERGSQQQAARAGETATAMEEMNSTVLEVARNAGDAAGVSEEAKNKASVGSEIVQQVIDGMQRIQKGSEELRTDMVDLSQKATDISTIMNVISDIADQTNLLALNAAIEAARAGEAGRGFAVVADEVRKLAENTMKATSEVGQAIQGIQQSTAKNMSNAEATVTLVREVTDLAGRSGEALNEIVHLVDHASDQVHAIATAAEQQSATSEEINKAIEDISRISNETADAMRLAGQAVQEMSKQAAILDRLIQEMKAS